VGERPVIELADGQRVQLPDVESCDFVVTWKSDDLRVARITRTSILGLDYKQDLVTNGRGPDRETGAQFCGTGSLSPRWIISIVAVPKLPGKRYRSRMVAH
jgi:hypothetical protein